MLDLQYVCMKTPNVRWKNNHQLHSDKYLSLCCIHKPHWLSSVSTSPSPECVFVHKEAHQMHMWLQTSHTSHCLSLSPPDSRPFYLNADCISPFNQTSNILISYMSVSDLRQRLLHFTLL